jgi:hypothetical protein
MYRHHKPDRAAATERKTKFVKNKQGFLVKVMETLAHLL